VLPAIALAPLILVTLTCAALMSRGIGVPMSAPPTSASNEAGAPICATYCQICHQPDSHGVVGKTAGDFAGNPEILAQSDDALLATIARGKTGCIGTAWGSILTRQQRPDLLASIRLAFGPGH
jgi:mono/diheme cytochrome c family protein